MKSMSVGVVLWVMGLSSCRSTAVESGIDFLKLLDSERKAISARQFLLLDLREGLIDEEEADR